MYTDPRTGTLSLGTDAPAGSSNRLICEARFPPPFDSLLPVLYTAEFDTSHGLCVAATFSVVGGDSSLGDLGGCTGVTSIKLDPPESSDTDMQMIVLYTIPLDLFAVISQGRCRQTCMNATQYEEEGNMLGGMGERIKGS